MALETVLRGVPIQLSDPTLHHPPEPDPGCRECAALQLQIDFASDPKCVGYDPSKAIDLRIAMNRHKVDEVAK